MDWHNHSVIWETIAAGCGVALIVIWLVASFAAAVYTMAAMCVLGVFAGSMYAEWPQRES